MNTNVATAERAPSRSLSTWEGFQTELQAREQAIVSMLPKHVSKDRFIASAVAAVKQTPGLLSCTPRSLFAAVTKSAQDGLLPDGREGVITMYGKEAQWNPMTYGLRKRARDLDTLLVDAQVVYENDTFVWHQGDEPRIEHEPAKLGKPRGKMIGAYAIFRREGEGILHREVMDREQIERVRDQAKAKDSLMWKKFTEEAWRKTVVRRGFKTVPCSEKLEQIVRRDDDQFAFDESPAAALTPPPAPRAAPDDVTEAEIVGDAQTESAAPTEPAQDETKPRQRKATARPAEEIGVPAFPGTGDPEAFRNWCEAILAAVPATAGVDALQDVFNEKIEPHLDALFPPDREDIYALYQKHERRFEE